MPSFLEYGAYEMTTSSGSTPSAQSVRYMQFDFKQPREISESLAYKNLAEKRQLEEERLQEWRMKLKLIRAVG
jgi:hypothetical protein